MAHGRKQIRDAVVTLVTGLATTGSRVFASRVYPLAAADLPGLSVYTLEESAEVSGISRPRTLGRILTLRVDAHAKATAALDDTLDAICAEVETALGDQKPAGAKDLRLANTSIEMVGEGDQPIGIAHMDFEIEYQTKENAPEVIV